MKLEIYGKIIQVGNEYGGPAVKIWLNREGSEVEGDDDDDVPMHEFLDCGLSEGDAIDVAKNLYEEVRITIETVPKPTLVGA